MELIKLLRRLGHDVDSDAGVDGRLDQRSSGTMYALAAHVYPTGIRATGVGTAVAIGRVGGVLSPYVGSWALEAGGGSQLFALIVVTMTVVFAALAGVRGHIPRSLPVAASHASTA
jgi:MFS transporter, AAHS family, 4-hydroxybenzoate transporter